MCVAFFARTRTRTGLGPRARPRRRSGAGSIAFGCAVLSLLLVGCAGTPPSSFYTLTPIPEAGERAGNIAGGGLSIGLGPVSFPQFLDRPQLVTRDGANRLGVDEFHRWGGTVQDDFLRVWGENLSYLLGTSRIVLFPRETRTPLDFRVLAEVITFEGTPNRNALLKVRWSVTDERRTSTLAAREDVYRCPIAGTGATDKETDATVRNAAIVAAMSRCLGEYSADVAAVLGALPVPVAPPALTPEG
jgi:uncharacterized lipoprotein YmbA